MVKVMISKIQSAGWVNNNARPFDASRIAKIVPMEKENQEKQESKITKKCLLQ